jgi:hypothetical protein
MRPLGALALALLAGCASAPRVPEIVQVPVPIACLRPGDLPDLPELLTYAHLARLDDYDLVRAIAAERAALAGWAVEVVPVLIACSRAPAIDTFRHRPL